VTAPVRNEALAAGSSIVHRRTAQTNAAWRDGLAPSTAPPSLIRAARRRRASSSPRRNPHSTRGTGVPHDSRVPSLEAFGRRPRCLPHPRDGPASETLHKSGPV